MPLGSGLHVLLLGCGPARSGLEVGVVLVDWTDEVKARLGQVLDSVAATQTVIFPGGAVLRAADIRAALEEIERRGNALDMYEHEVQGMKKRANRDEVLLSVKEQDRLDAHAAKEKAEAKLAEAAQEVMRLELVRMDGLARERGEEVARLRDLIVALSEDERGLVTAEVHDEADRIRAALAQEGE